MVYDTGVQQIVVFGGQDAQANQLNDTWVYSPRAVVRASWARYGSGCAGPVGVPTLDNSSGSVPRVGMSLQMQIGNLPSSPFNVAVGFIGFDAQQWNGGPLPLRLDSMGFPGCHAWLAPMIGLALPNQFGVAPWDVAIPLQLEIVGLHVYFQGGVVVSNWNPGGIVFSNAGDATIGNL
jgi:hypothetical protein